MEALGGCKQLAGKRVFFASPSCWQVIHKDWGEQESKSRLAEDTFWMHFRCGAHCVAPLISD